MSAHNSLMNLRSDGPMLVFSISYGARSRTRTGTDLSVRGILSPSPSEYTRIEESTTRAVS
jgi:hypothetical protein